MGVCVFLCIQKLQRVDTGTISPPPPSAPALPPSAPSLPPSAPALPPSAPAPPSASFDEVDELEKQLAKTKRIAELKRLLAEAQGALEEPSASRSTWNLPFRN